MKKICILFIFMLMFSAEASAININTNKNDNLPVILMYHRVSESGKEDAFTISAEDFEKDIYFLKKQGYRFLKAEDLKKSELLSEKSVVITFDDGYESDYNVVLPILKKYNASATFFVIGSLIGKEGYMSRDELEKLSNSDLVQIGNHSYNFHCFDNARVKRLFFTEPYKVIADFEQNMKSLQSITGKKITAVSYPYGIYGKYVDFELKKRGIVTFCSDEIVTDEAPFGRFNRSADVTANEIIKKLNNKLLILSKSYSGKN